MRNPVNQKATAALNRAYKQERPLESRITDFNYAPFPQERGDGDTNIDQDELNSAFILLSGQVRDNSTDAKAQHALGRFYLAKKDFKNAIVQFQKALNLVSDNAEIYSDLGTAYLEEYKAAKKPANADPARPLEALEQFEKAIRLNPHLLPPHFNRAICLQMQNLLGEARKAWEKYLQLDPDSAWGAEAKQRIQSIDSAMRSGISGDLEHNFLIAFRSNKDTVALELASQNRELIKTNYLPQLLVMSLVKAGPVGRNEKLAALQYLGELEHRRFGDKFASDLADFYKNLSDKTIKILEKAQDAVKQGYNLCLSDDFNAARDQFTIARDLFRAAGDLIEAHTVADYFVAYCNYRMGDRLQATDQLEEIARFAEKYSYKWFSLMNYYWILGGQESLGIKTVTQIIQDYEDALRTSLKMGDSYMTQKFIESLSAFGGYTNF